jgi:site-specific DNA recombinase
MSKRLRAGIYARYSTDSQREASIEDQFRVCERMAEREGFEVVKRFSDAAISGGTAERPGYKALLEAARSREIEVILAEDSSRLWREMAEQWRALKELQDLGVHVVGHSLDTRREEAKMLLAVTGAAAEAYRDEIARRTRRGLEGLARSGASAGGRSYGYVSASKSGTGRRDIHPEEAKIVKRIYERRAEGWSVQRITRQLNADGVPPPGAGWRRTERGPRRKNPFLGWTTSAIAGDPRKGTGILNNELYRGRLIWGRTRWQRGASDSSKRKVEEVPESEWIVCEDERLRIISDELWNKVHTVQTAVTPLREAVRKGIAKRGQHVRGHDSRYWLGSVLVCQCGSNYIGNGTRDYVCPAHTVDKCSNALRFRREDADEALFDLLREHLLSDKAIEQGRRQIQTMLEQQAREEERAAREAEEGIDVLRLDAEADALRRRTDLRPSMIAAGLTEIQAERAALLLRASEGRGHCESRARALLARLPAIVAAYRNQISRGVKALSEQTAIADARQAVRGLLKDGQIVLVPNSDGDGVEGPVRFKQIGEHVLELSGLKRRRRPEAVTAVETEKAEMVAGAGFEPATFGL